MSPILLACAAMTIFAPVTAARAAASLTGTTPNGRYAVDAASCRAQDYFVTITDEETVLSTFSCRKVTYDQIESKGGRARYRATSAQCYGEGSDKPHGEAFSLVVSDAGLQITWKDGSKSATFPRCADKR